MTKQIKKQTHRKTKQKQTQRKTKQKQTQRKTKQKQTSKKTQAQSQDRKKLLKLFSNINNNRKNLSKSQSNLPAQLININSKNITPLSNKVIAKSVSSTFSSVIHNGHRHSQGKQIVNDSTKPYLQIDEMENGNIQHYMIPKKTIPYQPNKFIKLSMNLQKNIKNTKKSSKKTKNTKT